MIKTSTHNNQTCIFDDSDHSYRIRETGKRLTSVTSVIKRYTPPFDAPAMAQKMVDKKNPQYIGMCALEIIHQWEKKAELASFEGTELHSLLERWPEKGCWGWHPKTYRLLMMSKQVDKLFPKLLARFRIVEAEKIVFSARLGLAGQVDLLMSDPETNEIVLIDWKSNSKITDSESSFGNMLPPIEHLTDADTVKYSLQLALYEKILVDEGFYPEFSGYRKSIIHIKETLGKVVKVENYEKEIELLTL